MFTPAYLLAMLRMEEIPQEGNKMLAELKLELFREQVTQAEVARAVGLSSAHFSRIIHGQARCRARLRRRIAEYLDVPEQKIFPPRRASRRNPIKK